MNQQEIVKYRNHKEFERGSKQRLQAGWRVTSMTSQPKHVNVGRTMAKALFTGGIGLMFGGPSRGGGAVVVVWER